jgi:redox-sensitive bicupin YhaK (pirin superfamily)
MRSVKKIHQAVEAPIDDLITYRAMPTQSIQYIDPFLFLNHHGPQHYPANNGGLPFGPHPHRGFETLTFILQGDIMHKDSSGGESIIDAGGIQWMTAGRGLIHAEVSSEKFKQEGGMEEVIQLWMNLPAKYKMVKPHYVGLQKDQIPEVKLDGDKVTMNLISGRWNETKGPINSLTGLFISSLYFQAGGIFKTTMENRQVILLYIVKGELVVNNHEVKAHDLVEFERIGDDLNIKATTDSVLIFGYGEAFHEPIVARGPFVMNSESEIERAYAEYQNGEFGSM